jgi:hypothetical protein
MTSDDLLHLSTRQFGMVEDCSLVYQPDSNICCYPCALTKHRTMKAYMGSWGILPRILDHGIGWRWVVSFTSRPIYPRERAPGTHWIGGWVGSRAGLDAVMKSEINWMEWWGLANFLIALIHYVPENNICRVIKIYRHGDAENFSFTAKETPKLH